MSKINWKEYNEKLVKRGEILFSTEFIENWKRELSSMNEKKRGHPYEYPNSYMQFLISIRYYCPSITEPLKDSVGTCQNSLIYQLLIIQQFTRGSSKWISIPLP